MTGEYLIDGLAVPESLDLLHDLLERVAREHPDVSAADLMMFETAVIEIAGNVVEHGRPPGEVTYGFRLEVLPDRLEGVLIDSGEELPPSPEATMPSHWDESGRGLALAGSVLDHLSYTRDEGENRWQMRRLRRARD
jgi:serine/threonine-protein kinase RsbW